MLKSVKIIGLECQHCVETCLNLKHLNITHDVKKRHMTTILKNFYLECGTFTMFSICYICLGTGH